MRKIFYIAIAMLFIACTETISIDVESGETRLSVEARITSDFKKHIVKLNESSDVFYANDPIPIRSAIVSVSDGTTNFKFVETKPGFYESEVEFAGEPGKTYHLTINDVDINNDDVKETYEAISYMPEPHVIDSIKLEYDDNYDSRGEDDEGEFYLVTIYMQDRADREDYYGFASRVNGVMVHETISEIKILKDEHSNGLYSKGKRVSELYQSQPDETLKNGDIVTLETYSYTAKFYDFVNQLQQMDGGQSMFSGSPGNIVGNVSNNAIGFFEVYSITRNSVTLNTAD